MNHRRLKYGGRRDKAFIGMAVNAASQIAGAAMNAIAGSKVAGAQKQADADERVNQANMAAAQLQASQGSKQGSLAQQAAAQKAKDAQAQQQAMPTTFGQPDLPNGGLSTIRPHLGMGGDFWGAFTQGVGAAVTNSGIDSWLTGKIGSLFKKKDGSDNNGDDSNDNSSDSTTPTSTDTNMDAGNSGIQTSNPTSGLMSSTILSDKPMVARYGILRRYPRNRAFLGSLISGAGALISANSKKKAILREQRRKNKEAMENAERTTAMSRSNAFNSFMSGYNESDFAPELTYRNGGSKQGSNTKVIDGGVAMPLGHNHLSLLRGATHEQVHNGKTGIGIKVGNKEIEAENNEVMQKTPTNVKIFSAQPIFNGISPADAVINGANPSQVFAMQELYKQMYGINDDGTKKRNGGEVLEDEVPLLYRRPVEKLRIAMRYGGRPKALVGYNDNKNWNIYGCDINGNALTAKDYPQLSAKEKSADTPTDDKTEDFKKRPVKDNKWGARFNYSDYLKLGVDTLGSLSLGLFNANAYKNLKADYQTPQFVSEMAVPFDTRYRIGAQLAELERARLNNNRAIASNTVSSQAAQNAMQTNNTNTAIEANKLWDTKFNKEAELRNRQAENEQAVRSRNAAARNQWSKDVAEIKNREQDQNNAYKLARAKALNASFSGLSNAVTNFLQSGTDRYEGDIAKAVLLAGSEHGTPARLASMGVPFSKDMRNRLYNSLVDDWSYYNNIKEPNKEDYMKDGVLDTTAYSNARKKYNNDMLRKRQTLNSLRLF